nr:hypothetical protein [Tanacetum cinerariifolium]
PGPAGARLRAGPLPARASAPAATRNLGPRGPLRGPFPALRACPNRARAAPAGSPGPQPGATPWWAGRRAWRGARLLARRARAARSANRGFCGPERPAATPAARTGSGWCWPPGAGGRRLLRGHAGRPAARRAVGPRQLRPPRGRAAGGRPRARLCGGRGRRLGGRGLPVQHYLRTGPALRAGPGAGRLAAAGRRHQPARAGHHGQRRAEPAPGSSHRQHSGRHCHADAGTGRARRLRPGQKSGPHVSGCLAGARAGRRAGAGHLSGGAGRQPVARRRYRGPRNPGGPAHSGALGGGPVADWAGAKGAALAGARRCRRRDAGGGRSAGAQRRRAGYPLGPERPVLWGHGAGGGHLAARGRALGQGHAAPRRQGRPLPHGPGHAAHLRVCLRAGVSAAAAGGPHGPRLAGGARAV